MAYQLTQDCIDMTVKMSASSHAVLVVLCRHASENGGDCYPSTALIAEKAHINPRTVMSAVKELERDSWVKCVQKPGKARFFLINVEKIRSCLTPAGIRTPVENYRTPLQESTGDSCNKLQESPAESYSRRDQLKDQGKKEVVVPVPAREESALHPTIDDFGIPAAAKDKATSTEAPEAASPQPSRPLQGPSYIDPVPFDEIVAAYNRHMAHIGGKVKALEPAQTDAVVAFWECLVIELWKTKDDEVKTRTGALEQVENYFRHCAADGFINGTAKRKPEYKNWIAKFDWLIRESTLRKMLGGGYAPRGAGKKEGR